jgi:FMN reductase
MHTNPPRITETADVDGHRQTQYAAEAAPAGEVPRPIAIVAISAGVSDPSSTRLLTDRVLAQVLKDASEAGRQATATVIELTSLADELAKALVAGFPSPRLSDAIDRLARADAIVASTPVYKGGVSGLFKLFVDLLDNDLLVAKPTLLVATAGTSRHSMVADDHMRPLFAFFRTLTAPTSVFAAPEDWSDPALSRRIARASTELVGLVLSGAGTAIVDRAWSQYQHQFGGSAARAERSTSDIDFDSDLMRLATGGSLIPVDTVSK